MVSEKSSEKPKREARYRNFVSIVYPESAVNGWIDKLADTHIPVFISPLHDKDKVTDETEEVKKAHFHVMLMYEQPRTQAVAQEIFDSIGAVKCQIVKELRGQTRYLCHLDNPDKAQYDPKDVQALNGADFYKVIGLSSDKYKALREIAAYCIEHQIIFYHEIFTYAAEHRDDWFRVLCDNGTTVIKAFLQSLDYQQKVIKEQTASLQLDKEAQKKSEEEAKIN